MENVHKVNTGRMRKGWLKNIQWLQDSGYSCEGQWQRVRGQQAFTRKAAFICPNEGVVTQKNLSKTWICWSKLIKNLHDIILLLTHITNWRNKMGYEKAQSYPFHHQHFQLSKPTSTQTPRDKDHKSCKQRASTHVSVSTLESEICGQLSSSITQSLLATLVGSMKLAMPTSVIWWQ